MMINDNDDDEVDEDDRNDDDLSFKSYTIAHTRITSRQFGVPLGS